MATSKIEAREPQTNASEVSPGEDSMVEELVANFQFKEQARGNVEAYIAELADSMSVPELELGLPKTAAGYAAMVELHDDPDVDENRLKILRRGFETSISTEVVDNLGDEVDFGKPKKDLDERTLQEALAILAEAAARFKVVAEADEFSGAGFIITRKIAERQHKQMVDAFVELAFDRSKKISPLTNLKRALATITLAMIACGLGGKLTPTPDVENNNPTPTEVIPDPTVEPEKPTPQPTMPPESITSLVGRFGYELREVGDGWTVATQEAPDGGSNLVLEIQNNAAGEQVIIVETEGQKKEYKSEAFEAVSTIALGLEEILVVNNEAGEVDMFFLPSTNEWVKPIEIQVNPEDPNTYPEITLQDVWSGKLLRSVALNAEEFPEGTLTPTMFVYENRRNFASSGAVLVPWIEGSSEKYTDHGFQDNVNASNDYRRWVSFTRAKMDSFYHGPDTEIIIATEQIKAPDGSTLFLNFVFGPEWPKEDHVLPNGDIVNLIDSVFLAKDEGNETDAERYFLEPVVSTGAGAGYSHSWENGSLVSTAGIEFYPGAGEGENVLNQILSPELAEILKEFRRSDEDFIIADVDDLAKMQEAVLLGDNRPLVKNYFPSAAQ